MKEINIRLENDRHYKEEYVMCRPKHVYKLSHEYTWIGNGNGDSEEYVNFPISVDIIIVRDDWTEMSIVRIQNGREEEIFRFDVEDSDEFEKAIKDLKQKGFKRIQDCDYI